MKSYLQLMLFRTNKQKKIIWRILGVILFCKMACFCPFLHYIAHSSTRGFETLTRSHGLMKGREWLKLMEIVNYGKRNRNHATNLNFDFFRALCARTTRARTRTDGKFWNALNDLVRTLLCWYWDFEQFFILTRAHTRGFGKARI